MKTFQDKLIDVLGDIACSLSNITDEIRETNEKLENGLFSHGVGFFNAGETVNIPTALSKIEDVLGGLKIRVVKEE